jgi:hypothetical protein
MAQASIRGLKFLYNDKEIKIHWSYANKPSKEAAASIKGLLCDRIGANEQDTLEFTSTDDMGVCLEAAADMVKEGQADQLSNVEDGMLVLHLDVKKARVAKAEKARGRCICLVNTSERSLMYRFIASPLIFCYCILTAKGHSERCQGSFFVMLCTWSSITNLLHLMHRRNEHHQRRNLLERS